MGDNRSQTVKNAKTGQMDQEGAWSLHIVLEKIDELASRKPSLSEMGLTNYFCDAMGSGYRKSGDIVRIESEMKDLVGEALRWPTIAPFNIGHPCHRSKRVHLLLRRYPDALRLKVPHVTIARCSNLLEENDK